MGVGVQSQFSSHLFKIVFAVLGRKTCLSSYESHSKKWAFLALESLHLNLNLGGAQAAEGSRSLSFGVQSATADIGNSVQGMLGQAGLGDIGLGSMAGMQLFWMATAAVVALAAAAVVKLSQQA